MSSASFVEDFQIISSYTGLVHRRLIVKLPPRRHMNGVECNCLMCTYLHVVFLYYCAYYLYICIHICTVHDPRCIERKKVLVFLQTI